MPPLPTAPIADDTTAQVAEAVVWGLRAFSDSAREARQLREALTSRATIDQAKGIIMGTHRVDADRAFAMLATLSQESNTPVAQVSQKLVDGSPATRGSGAVTAADGEGAQ